MRIASRRRHTAGNPAHTDRGRNLGQGGSGITLLQHRGLRRFSARGVSILPPSKWPILCASKHANPKPESLSLLRRLYRSPPLGPGKPFLYRGTVELWQERQLCDHYRSTTAFGLATGRRISFTVGMSRSRPDMQSLIRRARRNCHQAGFNAMFVTVRTTLFGKSRIGSVCSSSSEFLQFKT